MTFLKSQCPSSTYLSKHRSQSIGIIQEITCLDTMSECSKVQSSSLKFPVETCVLLPVVMCICKGLSKQGPLTSRAMEVQVCSSLKKSKCALLH